MEEHKDPPPGKNQNRGAEMTHWGENRYNLAATTPPPPPRAPTEAPKDPVFITPRKRGKRRLSSDSSNSEGEKRDGCPATAPTQRERKETAVKRQLQLRGRESRLSNSAINHQSGRGCDGRHGYHPSRQPNRHHHTGCHQWPGQRGEEKNPTGQQAEDCINSAKKQPCPQTEAGIPLRKTGPKIPKPARRQLPHESIPAEYPGTGIRGLPGGNPRLRRRIGQVRQARTMAPQPASQQRMQCAPLGRFPPGSGSLDAPLRPSRASWHAWTSCPGGSP